jgi:NAD kinase
MITIDLTQKELETVISGLRERENRMFLDAETYKNQGNKEAQMDCLDEMHIAEYTRRRLQAIKNQ